MTEWSKTDWFLLGVAVGWLGFPFLRLLTIIVKEAKIAKQEWKKPETIHRSRDEHAP